MRSTIIPAQITTVEDTIAGNLNLTQIVLLVSSVLIITFIYALVPERLAFSPFKITLMVTISIVFIVLSLRIKQRLVLNWLVILTTFALRPHLYLFNKNTEFARQIIVPKVTMQKTQAKSVTRKLKKQDIPLLAFDYQSLVRNPALNIRFKRNSVQVVKNYD